MNMKKWLCLALAALMALGTFALAEGDDLQAQLDAANARIAELEAEVEKYRPFYENQIVAEFGEDGIIWLEDAQAEFDEASAMYAQYGIPVDSYAAEIKQSIVESMVQQAVLDAKAAELGIGEPDEQTIADLTEEAASDLENYIGYYASYFAQEGASDEENRQATIDGLANAGITQDVLLEQRISQYKDEQLHTYVTADVAVDDADVQAEYEAMVADDEESYAEDDYAYNTARNQGEAIAWNPEGYRAVKHVLVKFSDDQATQYGELQDALQSLNDELAALDQPEEAEAEAEDAEAEAEDAEADAEEAEDAEADAEEAEDAEADAEEAEDAEVDAEEAEEAVEAPRTREEIQTDIGAVGASIEALYSELLPRAQEVIDAFNDGKDFDALIAEYNEDPGMQNEPTASQGYAVSAASTTWDSAFTEGAMSIAEVGQISEPVYGANGIHIIYYMSDITPGAVPFEEIEDAVREQALESKISETYDNQVSAWVEEAGVTYHLDRF